jgi:hypothetical protein
MEKAINNKAANDFYPPDQSMWVIINGSLSSIVD